MHRALCLGYNGDAAGGPNGCDCLESGRCGCVHAEVNALSKNGGGLEGGVCFLTCSPCPQCAKVLANTRIGRLVYLHPFRDKSGLETLKRANVTVESYADLARAGSYLPSVHTPSPDPHPFLRRFVAEALRLGQAGARIAPGTAVRHSSGLSYDYVGSDREDGEPGEFVRLRTPAGEEFSVTKSEFESHYDLE
jgi:tRNA(Arg) A34 adenosine deaminase TadA